MSHRWGWVGGWGEVPVALIRDSPCSKSSVERGRGHTSAGMACVRLVCSIAGIPNIPLRTQRQCRGEYSAREPVQWRVEPLAGTQLSGCFARGEFGLCCGAERHTCHTAVKSGVQMMEQKLAGVFRATGSEKFPLTGAHGAHCWLWG